MEPQNSSKSVVVGLISVVLGLAVGYGMATAMGDTEKNDTTPVASPSVKPSTATKAADLRVVLNALEREHIDLAAQATRAGFDGSPAFKDAAAQLDKNSNEIADAVGSVYGPDARTKFYEIWKSHIGFFVNYTVAAKAGDKAGMDKAVTDLGGYNDAISDFFSSVNPNLPRDAVHQLISDHIGLLKGAIDAYGAKNYAKSFDQEHMANIQIGKIADTISGAIVKQSPGKF